MGFLFFPMMPMGLRLAALRAAGAPLLSVLEDEDSFIEVGRIIKKTQKEKEKPYQQQQQTNIQKYYLLNYILFPLAFSFFISFTFLSF